ncbi:Ureidoglycolate lyase [Mesorhizobium plurifarium]|uniref:Ureidoglycolate lyase n=2 Tax=Mesorhizobium TaxID=68287 RepID=A0A090EVA8_MESPL|nr:Ureidoglycolate lyase [Mesorhizobium plurifarium]
MKLARIGQKGHEQPVLIDAEGKARSLVSKLSDIDANALSPAALKSLGALDVSVLPLVEGPFRYGVPVAGVRKFIAIGLNFSDHAQESNLPIPSEPIVFMKAISSLAGPDDDVPVPRGAKKVDWEVELGVVIGTRARYVSRGEAMAHVAGYVLVNDVSERSHQLERGGTWDKGKSHDGFGPVGPWLVTTDELGEGRGLSMFMNVSGQRCQTGNTDTMIFDVPTVVAYVSEFLTLEPGDIITTGTPPGVGMGMKPPRYLAAGDEMHLGIKGLGEQRQRVVIHDD